MGKTITNYHKIFNGLEGLLLSNIVFILLFCKSLYLYLPLFQIKCTRILRVIGSPTGTQLVFILLFCKSLYLYLPLFQIKCTRILRVIGSPTGTQLVFILLFCKSLYLYLPLFSDKMYKDIESHRISNRNTACIYSSLL